MNSSSAFGNQCFFRNDVPGSVLGYFAPILYFSMLTIPYFIFHEYFFRKDDTDTDPDARIVFFKVHKSSTNPFSTDGVQITLYEQYTEEHRRIVVVDGDDPEQAAADIVTFLTPCFADRSKATYLVAYDAHHQGLTLQYIMRKGGYKRNALSRVRFFDLKVMFFHRYQHIHALTFEDMVYMLGVRHIKPRVYAYRDVFHELLNRFGMSLNSVYQDIYAM